MMMTVKATAMFKHVKHQKKLKTAFKIKEDDLEKKGGRHQKIKINKTTSKMPKMPTIFPRD